MKVTAEPGVIGEWTSEWRQQGERVGLVPTMGNLHRGHLRLIEALQPHVDRLVVSIFVNPLQFGEGEDYGAYPRTWEADMDALSSYPVDAVFAPERDNMYPDGPPLTQVTVPALASTLCGANRPGHFDGVGLVVARLFQMVRPHAAAFGAKDFQQLQVVRTLVRDLAMPVEIVEVPTVREPDGLALSSRNQYIDTQQRRVAPALYQALCDAADAIRSGDSDWRARERHAIEALLEAGFNSVDYVAVRRRDDLQPPRSGDTAERTPLVVLGAAWLGTARLIDNVQVPMD